MEKLAVCMWCAAAAVSEYMLILSEKKKKSKGKKSKGKEEGERSHLGIMIPIPSVNFTNLSTIDLF